MIEKQELHCHHCSKYVQFELDLSLEGQHILNCPNCDHQHFRIIKDGKITGERWGQDPSQNIPTFYASSSTITFTSTSNFTTSTGGTTSSAITNDYMNRAWNNTTATGC